MRTGSKQKTQSASTDFRLVLSRLERDILNGEKMDLCLKYLKKETIWKSLGPEAQLRWARLAQKAGDLDSAFTVLSHINTTHPRFQDAWAERLELLSLLGRSEEAVRVMAAAKTVHDMNLPVAFNCFLKNTVVQEEDNLEQAASAPFDVYRSRQSAIDRYLSLFAGRENCFARQWVDKSEGKQGYVPVRRPIEHSDVEEHMSGRKTYGIYLLDSNSYVRTAVIDADLRKELRQSTRKGEEKIIIKRECIYLFKRIKELSSDVGLHPLIEYSGGKGYHFWYFFDPPIEASRAKSALEPLKKNLSPDLAAFTLEVFPKQNTLSGKGLGNLVKLPLGVHRLTGKRSFFMECHDRSPEAQLDFLRNVKTTRFDDFFIKSIRSVDENILIHPRWREWAEENPALVKLDSHCPPLSQLIAVCRQGNAISMREEKVLFQTLGFLPEAKRVLHYLMGFAPDYNPHLVDFKLSRLRGRPIGCKRIHSLLHFPGELCQFSSGHTYPHPLLHLGNSFDFALPKAEKIENLSSAVDNLRQAISQIERFIK